jgi:outer membrane protein OmpA-like peptidoglycan-associated protein
MVLASPALVQAETRGLYVGGALGVNFADDADITAGAVRDRLIYDPGPAASLSVGYGFGSVRAELEGSVRSNANGVVTGGSFNRLHGDARTWGLMVNGLYDIDLGSRFTPYVGAGVGLGIVDARLTGRVGAVRVTAYDDLDTTFAYQGIAGVAYAVSDRMHVTADYRYLGTTDASYRGGSATNGNHTLFAGIRYSLNAPVASATSEVEPPQPSATMSKSDYTVFFDWNKSDITADARKVISDAATEASQSRASAVIVIGHTDTSGSGSYNMKLSERRAAAVKRELIARGIDPSLVRIAGKGETDLLTPTPDGVRERSNRRAQIVLRVG